MTTPTPPIDARFWRSWRWWRHAGHVSAAVWLANGLAFVSTVVAARGLGVTDYGVFVLAISVSGLVARFLDLTLEEAVVHHGARALEHGDMTGLRRLFRTAIRLDLAIGAVVSGLVVLAAGPISAIVNDPEFAPIFVRLAALTTLASTLDGTTGAILLLSGRSEVRAWSQVGTSLFRLILVAIAASLGGTQAVLLAFAGGTALGAAVQALLSWYTGWRAWFHAPTDPGVVDPERSWVRILLAFGLHSSIWTSVTAVSTGIVPLFLGRLAGPSAAGIFDVAALPLKSAEVASDGLRLALFPQQARLAAKGDRDTLDRSVRFHTRVGISIGIPAALLGWIVAPWLIPLLYSHSFDRAIAPTRVLLLAAVASLSMGWAKTLMPALGRPQVRTRVSLLELALVAALLAVLGHRGATGGAIAVSTTFVLVALVWWVVGRRAIRQA